jgi:polyketide synthase-associated protein
VLVGLRGNGFEALMSWELLLTGGAPEFEEDGDDPERELKEFEGRLVEIHGLKEDLSPNAETTEAVGAKTIDFNGRCGRALRWDEEEQKYIVQTFDGLVAGISEENLQDFEPPDTLDGGFDIAWPTGSSTAYGLFAGMVGECLSTKGYCVVQMFTNEAVREGALEEARRLPPYEHLRAEFQVGYLGDDNTTKASLLEVDTLDKELLDALSYCDRDLSNMGTLLQPLAPEVLGCEIFSRSASLVRTPFPGNEVQYPAGLQDQDIYDRKTEKFLEFILRRKLCMMHLVSNAGGTLELFPKQHLDMDNVTLPLSTGRMVIFRPDLMGYCYHPLGEDSLAVQTWLLGIPQTMEFREMPEPPGMQGIGRVHVMSATERFPANCHDCDQTLALFTAGTDALSPVPIMRFDQDLYCSPDRDAPFYGKAYVMHGSFCGNDVLVEFDNAFFGISDEDTGFISPSQRWVMEVGYECLHKGGWRKPDLIGRRIGTFIGDSGSEWDCVNFAQDKHNISRNLGAITITRLSHVLGLTGPNVSVDTACSASLVAANSGIHMMKGYNMRKDGQDPRMFYQESIWLEYALCQGILVMLHPGAWIGECSATMLSFRGRCFTFDNSADGFIRGEGCCSAFLQAKHDEHLVIGERTLGTVMGSSVNQDGRSASLTAPHGPSQQECIRRSLVEAALKPTEVHTGELHGTGTALGDPIEVGANRGVMFGNRDPDAPMIHCTAKAHVGHEEANAGVCGLLKIVLMLNAGITTPNPHLRALNPHLDVHNYPILFANEPTCCRGAAQCYGVSSFGFGGTNSRADLWTETDKGHRKNGDRCFLSKEEAMTWVNRMLENVGTSQEKLGFIEAHKEGH